jgi:hypothetical protein
MGIEFVSGGNDLVTGIGADNDRYQVHHFSYF